jgi:hypothetical protein
MWVCKFLFSVKVGGGVDAGWENGVQRGKGIFLNSYSMRGRGGELHNYLTSDISVKDT